MGIQSFSAETTQNLVSVAMGRQPADLVIRQGRWVCVQSGEIIPNTDIAVSGERIAYVGPDASHTVGSETQIIEANDQYLSPGLLDGHMHVESSMLCVTEFVQSVIPNGTTGIFIDPHEIANVFGLRGVRLMVDEASLQPIHVWVQVPSCVPSSPGFETPGASITPDDVAEALTWNGVIGLGEVMNYPGVYNGDETMHQEMAATRSARKIIGGHYPSSDLDLPFYGYAAGGADDDHEGTRCEDAAARIRQGMKAMLRYGSAWHDVAQGVRAITEMKLDARHFILCTDDAHCQTLVVEGHVNRAIKQAISHGVSPITAIQMTTINTAEHFGVSKDVGMIAPGRFADILIIKDLYDFVPATVIAKGKVAAEQGQVLLPKPFFSYPDWVINSIRLPRPIEPNDFKISAPGSASGMQVIAHVIGVIENQAPTKHLRIPVSPKNGEVEADPERDLSKIALIDRHHSSGRIQTGLVSGFGLLGDCAIASTVAHDSHQMIVVGTKDNDMALAANTLAQIQGGQVVVRQGEVIGQVALPVAGLMSTLPARVVAQQTSSVLEGFRLCGCQMNNPNMQLSLLALVVIPELRISDLGLVDVNQFMFIPLIENFSSKG